MESRETREIQVLLDLRVPRGLQDLQEEMEARAILVRMEKQGLPVCPEDLAARETRAFRAEMGSRASLGYLEDLVSSRALYWYYL